MTHKERLHSVIAASKSFKETNDCVVMALAYALKKPYSEILKLCGKYGRQARFGTYKKTTKKVLKSLYYTYIDVTYRLYTPHKPTLYEVMDNCGDDDIYLVCTHDTDKDEGHMSAIVYGYLYDTADHGNMKVSYMWRIKPKMNTLGRVKNHFRLYKTDKLA